MKFLNADSFSKAPMFCLLPERKPLEDLSDYTAAYFARADSLDEIIKTASPQDIPKIKAERDMLKQIIDWSSLQLEYDKQKDLSEQSDE